MNLVSYLKDTISELKAVTWPKPETTVRLTLMVIGVSIVVAIYVGSLDFALTNILTQLIKK